MEKKNRVVIVTGGTSGIGRALAEKFVAKGDTVVVLSRSATDNGKNSFSCDVADSARVKEVFRTVIDNFGGIDILINNAGYGQSGALEFISEDAVNKIIDVNLRGVVNCTRSALAFMKPGGKIVNISSAAAFVPMPFRTMYSVTKSAVNMFSKGMAMELYGTGIQITALCLGDVQTDFANHRVIESETSSRYGNRIKRVDDFVSSRPNEKKASLQSTVNKLEKEIERKKFKDVRIIGAKWKFVSVVVRMLPDGAATSIVKRIFRG